MLETCQSGRMGFTANEVWGLNSTGSSNLPVSAKKCTPRFVEGCIFAFRACWNYWHPGFGITGTRDSKLQIMRYFRRIHRICCSLEPKLVSDIPMNRHNES